MCHGHVEIYRGCCWFRMTTERCAQPKQTLVICLHLYRQIAKHFLCLCILQLKDNLVRNVQFNIISSVRRMCMGHNTYTGRMRDTHFSSNAKCVVVHRLTSLVSRWCYDIMSQTTTIFTILPLGFVFDVICLLSAETMQNKSNLKRKKKKRNKWI